MNILSPPDRNSTEESRALRPYYEAVDARGYLWASVLEGYDYTSTRMLFDEASVRAKELAEYGTFMNNPPPEESPYLGQTAERGSLDWKGEWQEPDYSRPYSAGRPYTGDDAAKFRMGEEQWRKSQWFREGIEFDPRMTPIRAEALAEDFDARQARQTLLSKDAPAYLKGLSFLAQMGGSLPAPENFIPFIDDVLRLKMVARFGSKAGRMLASGADAAIGNAIFDGLAHQDLVSRGAELTFEDYTTDVLMGALLGGVFGFSAGQWSKFRGETPDHVKAALAHTVRALEEGREPNPFKYLREIVRDGQTVVDEIGPPLVRPRPREIIAEMEPLGDGHFRSQRTETYTRKQAQDIADYNTKRGFAAEVVEDGEGWAVRVPEGFTRDALETGEEISKMFEAVKRGERPEKIILSGIGPKEAAYFKARTGLDLSYHIHTVDADAIRHIEKRHGAEAPPDMRLTDREMRMIPEVIENHDRVYLGEAKQRAGGEVARIIHEKRINGKMIVVEEARTGKKELALVTAYKKDPGAPGIKAPGLTAEPTPGNVQRVDTGSGNVKERTIDGRALRDDPREFDIADDLAEPEDAGLEDVDMLRDDVEHIRAADRVTEDEAKELKAAESKVRQARSWKDALIAAARCLTRNG